MGFENGRLVRVVLRAQSVNQEQVTTFHYDLQDGQDQSSNDPQSLADAFRDDVVPLVKTFFSSAWTFDPVIVEDEIDPLSPNDARSQWQSGGGEVGTQGGVGGLLPPGTCPIGSLRTEHIGRRFRGRTFMMGTFDEGAQDDGLWGSNVVERLQAILDAIPKTPDLAPPLANAVAHWCVYSRTQRAADLDPYASAVTSAILRPECHFLRSRAIGN